MSVPSGTPAVSLRSRRVPRVNLRRREALTAWAFLTPNLLVWLTFSVASVFISLWLSFHRWDLLTEPQWVGVANYVKLFTNDRDFARAAMNTLFYVLGIVPLSTAASLALAVAMNQKLKGISFFRTAFYIPYVSSTVAVAVIWLWLYNPDYGLINYFLSQIGIQNTPGWIYDVHWAKPSIIIMNIWHYVGYFMILFLAGLQGIPPQVYEAAEVDGASKWAQFWKITLPLLSPTTFLVVVLRLIGAFQIMEEIFILTEGGPAGSTESVVYFIYKNAFEWFRMGYASAMAWVLFIVIFIFTLLQFKLQHEWVHYE